MNEKPYVLTAISGRRFSNSTEFYLCVDTSHNEFYVAIGCPEWDGKPIGYLKFVRAGEEKLRSKFTALGNFELQEVLMANSQAPSPIIALSGVLSHRQEAILADQSMSAYQAGLERKT